MDNFTYKELTIDFGARLVLHKGVEVKLDPKAFNTLALLIENRHRVVSNEELIEYIWDNRLTNNDVVTASIGRVRKIFKDARIKSDVIRTAHKVGYQFVLEETIPELATKPDEVSTRKLRFWYRVNIALFILLLGIAALLAKQAVDLKKQKLSINSATSASTDSAFLAGLENQKPTEIFFIRHGDKESDGTDDPPLSKLGIARSKRWRTLFQDINFDEIYTTKFIRNTQTVDYVFGNDIDNLRYYSALSFDIGAKLAQFSGKKIAIIGHSNTIPGMVNRLITDHQYDAMDHRNYELIYQVVVDSSGGVSANQLTLDYQFGD